MSKYKKKSSFLLHKDSVTIVQEMSNEQAGQLFKAIVHYQIHNEELDLDFGLRMAFTPFKNQFKRDDEKYNDVCEKRKKAAEKRWETDNPGESNCDQLDANASNWIQNNANNADSDSDSENDSGNENDSEKEKEKNFSALHFLKYEYPERFEKEFLRPWKYLIREFDKFQKKFNDTVVNEEIDFSENLIFERLERYTRNWLANQNASPKNRPQNCEQSLSDKIPTI